MNLGSPIVDKRPVSGGCIHRAYELRLADDRRVFLKSAGAAEAALLEAEARGLELLSPHIRVPRVIAQGDGAEPDAPAESSSDSGAWLALEWLDLQPLAGTAGWTALGEALAALHAVTAESAQGQAQHGLDHANFIGHTPQDNAPVASNTWAEFYLERRLRPQLRLAAARTRAGRELAASEAAILHRAAELLRDHEPSPALLHGDLWSGNVALLADGCACVCVFDPAPYHGDPETDLAMLELFGPPLPAAFLTAYGATPASEAARHTRRPLYHLYHALNHLNLFGDSYAGMVRGCLGEMGV